MYLAKNLKYLRLKNEYSQTEIADKTQSEVVEEAVTEYLDRKEKSHPH